MELPVAPTPFLLGNTFPLTSLDESVLIEPRSLSELKEALASRAWVSFWGHENTITAADILIDLDGITVRPDSERPALYFGRKQLPRFGQHFIPGMLAVKPGLCPWLSAFNRPGSFGRRHSGVAGVADVLETRLILRTMNPDLLISLVGEQPTPVFLAHKALDPVQHLLVATSKSGVKRAANNIASTLNLPKSAILPEVDSYDIKAAAEKIENAIKDFLQNGVHIALNLTGGTKTMALAGYELARKHKWRIYYLRDLRAMKYYTITILQMQPDLPRGLIRKLYLRS